MSAGIYDIVCDQGATFRLSMIWKDSTLTPIDLTNYTADMQVRTEFVEPGIMWEMKSSGAGITLGGVLGTIALFIDASDTAGLIPGEWHYDLLLTAPSGDKTRLIQGSFTITPAVTQ